MMRGFVSDTRGVVSVEFALAATFIMTAMLNAADLGGYVYQTMQVENAAQMAVQTALQSCTAAQLPVTTTCPDFSSKVSAAVAGTSLGAAVTVDAGQPAEAYYCVDADNRLMQVGTINSKPATCVAAGNSSVAPGDYVSIAVSYSFTPLMSGASVAALLTSPIRRSAIIRVG